MRRRFSHLLVAGHAMMALGVLGCYSQPSGSASPPAATELVAGTKAIVLAVPGMH